MKKAFNFLFVTTKAGFFLLAALLWSAVMYFVNNHYQITWEEIFVEADGMVFDLIVFGVVLTIYEAFREIKEKKERVLREKNEKIERLFEEIDDYRGWDEKEAMYRIVGTVKRLNNLGVSNIDLRECFLWHARLTRSNLSRANIVFGNLKGARLMEANLTGANLWGAGLFEATLSWADLSAAILKEANLAGATLLGANLGGANLEMADFRGANLSGANLLGANLDRVNLRETNLEGAQVGNGWFKELERWLVKGRTEIIEKYVIDVNGRLQLK